MRVFLDASVFIWAMERPASNSARIVGLVLSRDLAAVVDEEVLNEVSRFVRKTLTRSHAWLYRQQIARNAEVVSRSACDAELARLQVSLKANDRLHVAAMRVSGARYLVAYDEDFKGLPEYLTPKQAVKRLGMRAAPTEW